MTTRTRCTPDNVRVYRGERRNGTTAHWVAFCLGCGWSERAPTRTDADDLVTQHLPPRQEPE